MDLTAHFNLRKVPFTREIVVSDLYAYPQRDELIAAMLRLLDQRMSGALIAPAGFGKTTLIRTLRDQLPGARYDVHYVKVTGLSKRDMCRWTADWCCRCCLWGSRRWRGRSGVPSSKI